MRGENGVECVDIYRFIRIRLCVCVRLNRKENRTEKNRRIQNRTERMCIRTYHLLFLERYGQVCPTLHLPHHRLIHPQCDPDRRHVVSMPPMIINIRISINKKQCSKT